MKMFPKYLLVLFICLMSPLAVVAEEAKDVFVVVNLSDDMKYRAEHIPDTGNDTPGSIVKATGFLENGHYGVKELEDLTDSLRKKLGKRLTKNGMTVSFETDVVPDYVLNVLIVDAKTNLPTNRQLSKGTKLTANLITL